MLSHPAGTLTAGWRDLFDQMPRGLTPREVNHLLSIKHGILLQLDLHPLPIPLGKSVLDVAFDGIDRRRIELPVALHGCRALVVPHADRGPRCMAHKTQGMSVGAADDLVFVGRRAGAGEHLVAGAAGGKLPRQNILPTVPESKSYP